jgi:hypothetical protein
MDKGAIARANIQDNADLPEGPELFSDPSMIHPALLSPFDYVHGILLVGVA